MQSTEAHGARAKTSTSRTSSTKSARGQIPHIAITISGMDCIFTEETQPLTNVTTQTWTLSPTTKRKKHDPEQPVGIGNPQNHQTKQPDPPYPKAPHNSQTETGRETWTPRQTYDNQGCANFHENSEGTVLTSPSGHPLCAYCRTPSHPRSTCPMRTEHLAQGINRLYHPQKGLVQSNNERRRCNKFPDITPVANHNIAGTSKIRAESIHNSGVSDFRQSIRPENVTKFVNQMDEYGKPNFWSNNDQLMTSQTGHILCGYCGVPSHSRKNCKLRLQLEKEGIFYDSHPNRGQILSKNQSTRQLQPTTGASYKMFKQHSYHNKERSRSIQERSMKINIQQDNNSSWDFNHNSPPANSSDNINPIQHRKPTAPTETAPSRSPIKHRAQWANNYKMSSSPQNNGGGLSSMPTEILEQILGYLSFQQRIGVQRINQRFRDATMTPKLWKSVVIQNRLITNPIVKNILRAQTTSLDLPGCVWRAHQTEEIDMENFLILNPPKLTYLGLQEFGGNNSIAATLIILSKNLATLDLSEADFTFLGRILDKLDRTNNITSINLSVMKTTPNQRQPSALAEMYSPVRSNTIADLVTKCIKLTDLVLCGADLSQDSITQICHLVTPTLTAINLAREHVKNEHVDALTIRCPNIKYINLSETKISYEIFPRMVSRWRYSMRDLSLPEQIARQLKLFSDFGPYERRDEFATLIKSMPRMERLHVGHFRFEHTDVMYRRTTVKMLSTMFPKLLINPNPFGTLGPSTSDPGRKYRNNIRPNSWVLRNRH